jgi:ribA/ribD-fused uncharacterized protein
VKFLSYKDRDTLLLRFRQKEAQQNISSEIRIIEDFPFEIDQRRSKLLPYLHTARHLKTPCKLAVDRLTIDGHLYTVDTTDEIPEKFHPQATKEIGDDVIAFYHKESPFSNFYPTKFSADSKVFSSVEQYFVYKKAELFKDEELAVEVLGMDNPAKIKGKGKTVKGFNAKLWSKEQVRIMREGIVCKFDQNPTLKSTLANTRNKILVEASPHDRFWGAGLSLFDPKLRDPQDWPGKNTLRELLSEVRREICG